ncbi:MAG: O-antigen ligase family protein, partial [Patescibacteria group bacterium]
MRLDKVLLHIIRYGVYFSLFIPLFVTKYLYFPYNSTKAFAFRIIIEIIFAAWLILVFRRRIKLPKFNYLVWAILIFTGMMFISMIFGVEWYRSWWGTIERGSGLFIFLHYLAFFFILISVFKEKKDWQRLINLFLISSLLASLYAFAQTLNLPIVHEAGLDRASGSIGNAAFLASYLIFGLFLSLGMVFKKNLASFWQHSFYVFIFFITLAGIILTKTRGAVIGLTAGIFIFILLISIFHKNKKAKIIAAGLILVLFFSITLTFINKDSEFVKNNSYLYRLTYINFQETTVTQRLYSWRAGLKAFAEKPIFGWGPENYNAAYNKYFDASYYDISRSSTYFDKAHNILIEILVTSGIFGLAAYLFLLFLILYYLYKIYKKKNEDLL